MPESHPSDSAAAPGGGGGTFVSRMTRVPRAHDAERGDEILNNLPDLPPEASALMHGVAGSSPYLAGLAQREAVWLSGALSRAPEVVLEEVLSAEVASAGPDLRVAKRRVALLTALADLAGVWPLEAVTGALTRLADHAVHVALLDALGTLGDRGRVVEPLREAPARGVAILAMGKMGAGELNYSSDIDLICLFDEDAYGATDLPEARAGLVRAVRTMCRTLSDTGPEGYVFRTDLRLRPDPSVTPVCVGMDAAMRYYESLGRTWERAAHIKARAAAGDVAGGADYLRRLGPFVWRRHLDFAAIEDAHDIRLRIHEREGPDDALEGRNVKLSPGGIRDIEFFAQTHQLIAGGRDDDLRVPGTVAALSRLAAAGWIEADVAEELGRDYRAHREVEHRLQMVGDLQTHDLPGDSAGFDRLAALMDRDVTALKSEIAERFRRVEAATGSFFARERKAHAGPALTERQEEIIQGWRATPALRSERAREIFARIRPRLLSELLDGPAPDRALTHFDGFLRGLPSGVQIFSLFEANPELSSFIADVAGTSADLAGHLSRNAAVLDAVIGGDFFSPWPGAGVLEEDLSRRIWAEADYERQLDAARRWAREWHFRIGVHHLRGLIDGAAAGGQYAELAEATIRGLWPAILSEVSGRYGPPPGDGAAVIAMGSLGAGHLTAHSDLDLIVVFDAAGLEASEGARSLSARSYYAKLTQALVTALSALTAEGRLYEVDMRLRPSGRQGPVAASLAAFAEYQRSEAWSWEHMALTRARPLVGPERVMSEVSAVRAEIIARPRDARGLRADAAHMLERLRQAKPAGPWEVKAGPGGLTEIEITAQMAALMSGATARDTASQLSQGQMPDALAEAHRLQQRFQDARRLLAGGVFDPAALGAGGTGMMLRETGAADMAALSDALTAARQSAAEAVDRVTGAP